MLLMHACTEKTLHKSHLDVIIGIIAQRFFFLVQHVTDVLIGKTPHRNLYTIIHRIITRFFLQRVLERVLLKREKTQGK